MNKNTSFEYYVKLDGLSYSATPREVLEFLNDVEIVQGERGVRFLKNSAGRPTGECVIKLMGIEEDFKKVLAYHGKYLGRRYVNVSRCDKRAFDNALNTPNKEFIIRLRGLPYSATINDINEFFRDLEIVDNGIVIPKEDGGRPLGIAFVHFANEESFNRAFTYDKKNIGSRYVEVFASSLDELNRRKDKFENKPQKNSSSRYQGGGRSPPPQPRNNFDNYNERRRYNREESYDRYNDHQRRPPPNYNEDYESYRGDHRNNPHGDNRHYERDYNRDYNRYDAGDYRAAARGPPQASAPAPTPTQRRPNSYDDNYHVIRVEGLPYEATKNEIRQFFSPDNPTHINVILDKSGRSSGYGDVYFSTHEECLNAMKKDKDYLGGRYLKLQLFSKKSPTQIKRDFPPPPPPPPHTATNYYQPPSESSSHPIPPPSKEMAYQYPQPDPYGYPTAMNYPPYPVNYGQYYGGLSSAPNTAAAPTSYPPPNYGAPPHAVYAGVQTNNNIAPYAPQNPTIPPPMATNHQLYNNSNRPPLITATGASNQTHNNPTEKTKYTKY